MLLSWKMAASSDPVQIDYVVQNGDTLESIADATHQSVGAIQQANPGIGNLKPGQHVAIPNKPGGGQQQAQPAQPPAGAQILPGLLPNQAGGAVSIAAGQNNQLAPNQMVPNLIPWLSASSKCIQSCPLCADFIYGQSYGLHRLITVER